MKLRFTPISARYLSVNDKIDGYMASRLNADARCYSYDAFLFYILQSIVVFGNSLYSDMSRFLQLSRGELLGSYLSCSFVMFLRVYT